MKKLPEATRTANKRAANKRWQIAHRERMRELNRTSYYKHKEKRQAASRLYKRNKMGIKDADSAAKTGTCPICGITASLVLDHNHNSGLFRGWLCSHCNLALGLFKDNYYLLIAATRYLMERDNARAN